MGDGADHADLEAGRVSRRRSPTLFMLCEAFSDLLDRSVTLAELFAGDGMVALTADAAFAVKLADLRAALAGRPLDPASCRGRTPSQD